MIWVAKKYYHTKLTNPIDPFFGKKLAKENPQSVANPREEWTCAPESKMGNGPSHHHHKPFEKLFSSLGHTSVGHHVPGHPSVGHHNPGHSSVGHHVAGHPSSVGHYVPGHPSVGHHVAGHPSSVGHHIPGHSSAGQVSNSFVWCISQHLAQVESGEVDPELLEHLNNAKRLLSSSSPTIAQVNFCAGSAAKRLQRSPSFGSRRAPTVASTSTRPSSTSWCCFCECLLCPSSS